MGKKHFDFFQTAETGKRTPNSGVKGNGANHYTRAHTQPIWGSYLFDAQIVHDLKYYYLKLYNAIKALYILWIIALWCSMTPKSRFFSHNLTTHQ